MEKFAVDLDAVLDEFEFHEGQAEASAASQRSPSVTGFFSPQTESPPSPTPLPTKLCELPTAPAGSNRTESCVRYDLPLLPSTGPKATNGHTEDVDVKTDNDHAEYSQQESNHVFEDLVSNSSVNAISSLPLVKSKEDVDFKASNEKEVKFDNRLVISPIVNDLGKTQMDDPLVVFQTDSDFENTQRDDTLVDNIVSNEDTTQFEYHPSFDPNVNCKEDDQLDDQLVIDKDVSNPNESPLLSNEDVSECSDGVLPTEKDLGKENPCLNVDFIPGDRYKTDIHDDYVDESQVEKYLEEIKVAEQSEDYVDEEQLEEYLKQLEMEKEEQNLLDNHLDPSEEDNNRPVKNYEHLQEINNSEDHNGNDANNTSEINATTEPITESILELGTGPTISTLELESGHTIYSLEQGSCQTILEQDPGQTISSLELGADLHPEINSQPDQTYQEEAEHVDLADEELTPQIGVESPPPYSEVDPMTRPTSLALDSDTTPPPVLGAPGSTPSNPTGPRVGESDLLAGLSEDQLLLGKVQPFWVPDSDAPQCMICGVRFTMVKRRHHCRACGKVLCATCCGDKHVLEYLEGKEGRVCTPCRAVLERLDAVQKTGNNLTSPSAPPSVDPRSQGAIRRPNPANPMEYCSTIPVSEQVAASGTQVTPSVMVPVGVLKRQSDESERQENKSVMFSDGIRPGGDLTELDGRGGGGEHRTLGKRASRGKSRGRSRGRVGGPVGGQDVCVSMLPETGLPLVSGRGVVDEEEVLVWLSAGTYVNFVMNKNLNVVVKRLHYPPINKLCWNFATRGLTSVGQDEVVILLEVEGDEQLPPREVFTMLQSLYEQAGGGTPVAEMGHLTVGPDYLGSNSHGGWLFIRHSHQTVTDLLLPPPPLLFGVLVMRWEIPWARVAPLRLMLRLGAEFRYYPAPLVSVRGRKPVYGEIGHTIMNVLADFKNYTYALPTIRGLVIHMSTGRTNILLPKNRYNAVVKALNTSNETVLALGANFSTSADSHLVAIQGDDGGYQTQAINIVNKERTVTGASFVVFNGALKSSANLTAKSSIVEDGLMVQVLPDHMTNIRKSLHNMQNLEIGCGPVGSEVPDEVVSIVWVDEDKAFNIGIKSVLDGKPMDGISSLRIHSGPDLTQDNCLIRWTEVFLLDTGERPGGGSPTHQDPPDPARAAEGVARSASLALLPHLPTLKHEGLTPLAVRVCLDPDNVNYEAGSGGKPLPPTYMNSLDNELVPVLHSGQLASSGMSLELVFHVLDH